MKKTAITTSTVIDSKNTVKTTHDIVPDKKVIKEVQKTEAEMKKQAIEKALALIEEQAKSDVTLIVGQAGKILASLDTVLARIAEDVVKTEENAAVWNLELTPITISIKDVKRQWIEVAGLDRNARVQLIDDGQGKIEIVITPKKARSMEAQAYFNALVVVGQDLTKAVALRKAVAGRTFRQVWAIAQAQEKARIEKKYAEFIPPTPVQKAKLEKASDNTVA